MIIKVHHEANGMTEIAAVVEKKNYRGA